MQLLQLACIVATALAVYDPPRAPANLQLPTCNLLPATAFDGADVASSPGLSPSACCQACQTTLGCAAFTLYNSTCYLKDSSAAARHATDCTSGRRPEPAGDRCNITSGISVGNVSVGAVAAFSPGECCTACEQRVGCAVWTLYNSTCYMKQQSSGSTECAECISGWQPGGAIPLPDEWQIKGITFTGGRYCPNVTFGSAASEESMRRLRSTGANWVSLVVTGYQQRINSTSVCPLYNGSQVRDTTSRYYEFVTVTPNQLQSAIRCAQP